MRPTFHCALLCDCTRVMCFSTAATAALDDERRNLLESNTVTSSSHHALRVDNAGVPKASTDIFYTTGIDTATQEGLR